MGSLSAIGSFLIANLAPILGSTLAGLALTWILGRLTDSEAGGNLLAKATRQARRIGRSHSALGNSKLGPLWNPIETFGTTWIRSLLDAYFIGLREDNLEKLGDELERLEKSGSVKRAEAIKKRMEEVIGAPKPIHTAEDAAMFQQAFKTADESIKGKLGE